jgi:competence protein ComEC
LPLALIGLFGASSGEGFDLAVAPTGEAAALRLGNGELTMLGRKPGAFVTEQWLRADADPRSPKDAANGVSCDTLGCVGRAFDGRMVALVYDKTALIEDCARAAILITPLYAPQGCAAPIVIDRRKLADTGAVTLRFKDKRDDWTMARGTDEDRPWSRAPSRRTRPAARQKNESEPNAVAPDDDAE